MRRLSRHIAWNACLTWLIILAPLSLPSRAADLAQQRQTFHEAREALAHGDTATFRDLLPGLTGYPLYGYLLYDEIKGRINEASDREVQNFLRGYADLPVSALLRNVWLKHLAEESRWPDFLATYRDTSDLSLRCLRIQALVGAHEGDTATDNRESSLSSSPWSEEVRTLWLVGKNQPPECEDLFALWHQRGGLTTDDLWQRVVLAFGAGNVDLAENISLWLPTNLRPWVQVWTRVHRSPESGLGDPLLATDSPRARAVIRHGVTRLARSDIDTALERWEHLQGRYAFTREERFNTERSIALRAALEHHPRATELFNHLSFSDGEVRRARVRAALWDQDWDAVLRAVHAMKPWERTADRWRYWEARALEEIGENGAARTQAREIYRDLAGHRSYHGFLAADKLNQAYAFNHQPLATSEADIARFAAQPAVVRARELFLTDYLPDGRREWTAAITNVGPAELAAAAQLAARWGWPDRVISTLGRSPEDGDLVLRFPLPYRDQVMTQATLLGISPTVVYAVIRQESVFMADARSAVGALGLMQLMPTTAAQVAKKIRAAYSGSSDLVDPDHNIRLGSAFLADLINRQGSVALAAAAYNAGPGRIKQWRPPSEMAADIWVECIPFDETRRYVRNVLTYAAIYGWRLQRQVVRLTDGMPVVEP